MLQQIFKISINIQSVFLSSQPLDYYTSIRSFYGIAEKPVLPSYCDWTDCILTEIAVRGKVILQPHGKEFFTGYGKQFFYILW